jgi:hypothetical protein
MLCDRAFEKGGAGREACARQQTTGANIRVSQMDSIQFAPSHAHFCEEHAQPAWQVLILRASSFVDLREKQRTNRFRLIPPPFLYYLPGKI